MQRLAMNGEEVGTGATDLFNAFAACEGARTSKLLQAPFVVSVFAKTSTKTLGNGAKTSTKTTKTCAQTTAKTHTKTPAQTTPETTVFAMQIDYLRQLTQPAAGSELLFEDF